MFTIENSIDLVTPCPRFISIAAVIPQWDFVNKAAATSLMCLTDAYAIASFISCCRMHNKAVILAPIIVKGVIKGCIGDTIRGSIVNSRIMPYLPSLSIILARIIDPATGASVWAFGSHRCSP